MSNKTFLEKLENNNHITTYHCKENDAVLVFTKEPGDTGEIEILTDKNAREAIVIGLKDLKTALKNKRI